ncbi:MAG: CoA transferase [Armatimonadota bacterium]|nr:CoA transferase [Armatimonadota bacterium]
MTRVLDLTDDTMVYAGRLLADLGCRVTRVVLPDARSAGGDAGHAGRPGAVSRYFTAGVDTVRVDTRRGDAHRVLLDLCASADVLIEGLAPRVADPAGLRDAARRVAPRLTWVAVREFARGVDDPAPGSGILRYARSGLMSITGDPSGPPLVAGGEMPDAIVAAYAALAALLGARDARARGEGRVIWVSAHEALASFASQGLLEAALTDRVVRRAGGRHAHIAMAGALPCRDGWVVISANERGMWRALVETIGDARLRDPALDDERERMRRQADIFAMVAEWTARFGKDELCDLLQARLIPVAPVHAPLDVARDPHLAARRFFGDGDRGGLARLTPPWRSPQDEFTAGRALPALRAGPFTLTDFVRWAGYQENWLRIHYDETHAVGRARLAGPVQSGNHRTALLLRMLTDWLGSRGHVRRLSVRHVAPVHVGDAITCDGRIVATAPGANGGLIVDLALRARLDDGRIASEGTGVVEVTT